MGDFSELPSLCASPRGLFLHTRMVFYEKGRRCMKAVVSIFKMIRFPFLNGHPIYDLFVPSDFWWFLFGAAPFFCVFAALMNLLDNPGSFSIVLEVGFMIYLVTLISVIYWHRDKPFRLIGAKMKFMIEVIPMITSAGLRHLLEFNYGYLALLLLCTTNFYIFAHFMHTAYDVGGIDVFLGLVMQVLAYTLNVELSIRALALSIFFGLCLYRYMTYCTPKVPAHRKKELERLPC